VWVSWILVRFTEIVIVDVYFQEPRSLVVEEANNEVATHELGFSNFEEI
jgi:hypothetical protein